MKKKMKEAQKIKSYSGWASGKCVVVGITGGIAAYKIPYLVNLLKYQGADVHVILTAHGAQFVTPVTLQTLSMNPVRTEMFDAGSPRFAGLPRPRKAGEAGQAWKMEHIDLADRADLMVVAPATANVLGKVAHGLADDLLSTTLMSTRAPVLFCPSMNVHMYANPVVQENIARLKKRGYHVLDPEEGDLACGYQGKGRLPEPDTILLSIQSLLT